MEQAPAWTFTWCYFFAFMGVVSLLTGVAGLAMFKKLGLTLTALSLVAALVQAATAFTLFYMCRSSLASAQQYAYA